MPAFASLNTSLCALLGCQYPIIQTAMGWVSGPELVAATGNAGGFGFLAGATIPPDAMEAEIERTRQLTRAPFGVNFHMYQPNAEAIVDLVIKHKVRAISYSRSPDGAIVKALKAHQVVCMPTIGLPKHALAAIEMGADALTVQGAEGGGHTGSVPSTLLIPKVVGLVAGRVPIAAAGGFHNGRDLVAALAWGADGVAMGTRFLMSQESAPPEATKNYYVACDNPDHIQVSKALDGLPHRMIENEALRKLQRAGGVKLLWLALVNALKYRKFTNASLFDLVRTALSLSRSGTMSLAQAMMSANAPMIIQKSMVDGDPEQGVLPSGQVASMISQLESCEEIIAGIVTEATACLQHLTQGSGIETSKAGQADESSL